MSDKKHSKKEKKQMDKSLKAILIGAGIVIVLIAAILYLSKNVFTNTNVVEYNHYTFERYEGDKWVTNQLIRGQVYSIPFYHNPTEVLDIPVDNKSVLAIRQFSLARPNGTIYISVDPQESSKVVIAGVEYARILGKGYNMYNMNVKSAITQPIDLEAGGPPIITCEDVSPNVFVIQQIITDKNLVSYDKNCIIIESKDVNESIRVADAFSFRLLNIISLSTN
ncbi:MAG TPA: hypothetical protein VEC16_04695 [Alphaproteobacteria bacterium]|nr:hypothetical protein [Alphaproteobacteria bacterium]